MNWRRKVSGISPSCSSFPLPLQFFPPPRPCQPAQARTPAGRRLQKRMENQSLAQKPWAAVAAPAVAQKALSPQLSPLALRTWQSLHGAEVSPTEPSCLSPLPQCQQWAGVYPTPTTGLRPIASSTLKVAVSLWCPP